MLRLRASALTLAFVAAAPAAAQRPARAADPAVALERYVAAALAEWGLPGTAIAVVRNDSVVYSRGFGVRELGKPEPITPSTVFAIASTTKAFTATALGMLVDEKKVTWDDRVTQHLTGFQLFDPYVTRELTVRDLLTHRSGLSRGDRLWAGSQFDRSEVLRRVRFLEPTTSFRSAYGYQNVMFLAAGTVVESASGMSWDDFLQRRIFDPLGMRHTVTSVTRLGTLPDVATPHERADNGYRPVPWNNVDNLAGAGSMISSVADMSQWLRMQLAGGTYGGKRLIEEKTLRETHTPQMIQRRSEEDTRLWPMSNLVAYGLGWSVRDYHGKAMVSHGGSLRGMRTQVVMIPSARIGVVAITNSTQGSFTSAIANTAIDLYLGHPAHDWSAKLLASTKAGEAREAEARRKRESERAPETTPSLPIARYVATYADSMYGDITIAAENDNLVMTFGPQVGDLRHWHYDTFQVAWRDSVNGRAFVTFTLGTDGQVRALVMDGLGTFGRRK